jgi:signal transduction histidine kinase
MDDPSKFFNVVIDRTNQKLNSFQAQIIVLESQLQMAVNERDEYKKYVDIFSAHNIDINNIENIKIKYSNMQSHMEAVREVFSAHNIDITDAEDIKNKFLVMQSQIEAVKEERTALTNSAKYIKDQNETLLHEVRRLQRLVNELS